MTAPGPKDFREVAVWGCKFYLRVMSGSTRKRTSRWSSCRHQVVFFVLVL